MDRHWPRLPRVLQIAQRVWMPGRVGYSEGNAAYKRWPGSVGIRSYLVSYVEGTASLAMSAEVSATRACMFESMTS